MAAKRLSDMLKPGARLFLKDVMISVDIGDFCKSADYWVENTRDESGDKPAEAVMLCLWEEYT